MTTTRGWLGRVALAGLVALTVAAAGTAATNAAPVSRRTPIVRSTSAFPQAAQVAEPVGYKAVTPVRVVDTRMDLGGSRLPAGGEAKFQLGGKAGVPAGAAAVSINLTAAAPSAAGYLTAYPCGGSVPSTSTVNYVGGQPSANGAVVTLGPGGLMCVTSYADSDVVIDVSGYFVPNGSGFTPSPPLRLVDSRLSPVPVAAAPLPPNAVASVLNITAASPQSDGYLSLVPCPETTAGTTSTVNFVAGVIRANMAISPMANDCVFTYGTTARITDYFGAFGSGGSLYYPNPQPLREFDSRTGGAPLPAGGVYELRLPAEKAGVVTAVNVNVTATQPAGDGYMTVYPCGQGAPNASNLNYRAGDTVAASAFGSFDANGRLCITTSAASHLVVDLAGSFGGSFVGGGPSPEPLPDGLDPGPKPLGPLDGVRITPSSSIQATLAANPPGATIILEPGVYRQTEIRPKNGQKIVGELGAVVSGARGVGGFVQQGSVWVAGGQPTDQPGFAGDCMDGFSQCGLPDDLYLNDVPLRRVGARGAVAAGTWFYDYGAGEIVIGNNPGGARVEMAIPNQHAFLADQGVGGNGVEIRNLVIEKFGSRGQECAIMAQDSGGGWQNVLDPNNGLSGGWRIADNDIRLNHACGVFAGPGNIVEDNFIRDNGQLGVKAAGRRALIRRNDIARNNYNGFQTYWEAGGGKFWNAADLLFTGNYSHDNLGAGIWADYSLQNIVYHSNLITNNRNAGISQEMTISGAAINNVLTGNDWINKGNVGNTAGAIFIYNGSNFEVTGNTIANNNGGVVVQAQDRGCIGANIVQMQGACPPGSVRASVEGVNVHHNDVTITEGRHGLIMLYQTDYPPYAKHSPAYAAGFFDLQKVKFRNNTYHATPVTGSGDPEYRNTSRHLVWAFPAGFAPGNNPANLETWTTQRFLGFNEWNAIVEQGSAGYS